MGRALGIALGVPGLAVGDDLDAATLAYQTAITDAGGTIPAASLAANDALVKGLKADALWDLMHEIYTFSGDFTAALVKLKTVTGQDSLTNFNFVAGDYSESGGLTGNGTDKYLATGFIPSNHLTATSASFGVWNHDSTVKSGSTLGCQQSGSSRMILTAPHPTLGIISDIYDTSGGRLINTGGLGALSTPYEFICGSRTSASAHSTYQNGVSNGNNSSAGGTVSNVEMYMFRANGVGGTYTAYTLSFGFVGDGLTDAQMLNLYNRVSTFQQALGRA